MKILVTGGMGFIGSHTVVELLKLNYEVVVVDNLCNSKKEVLNRIHLITGKIVKFFELDVTNYQVMEDVFRSENFDCIIHFAALKSNADSIVKPGVYYENNIQSIFVLVSLMEKYKVKKIIFSSSATVYGNNPNVPISENEIIGNVISPYGMTKYLAELYLQNRSNSTKLFKAISLRYFNPIGAHPSGLLGEDSPDKIPNNLMLYLLKVAKNELPYLNVFGNDYNTIDGTGVRDYIHVVDLSLGHISAINFFDVMANNYEAFNLGTGSGYTVLEVVKSFEKVSGKKVHIHFAPRRPGDVEKSYADVHKANRLLGWKTERGIDECTRDAYNFMLKNPYGYDK